MFDRFGGVKGASQIAPGRDVAQPRRRPGQGGVIDSAILGGFGAPSSSVPGPLGAAPGLKSVVSQPAPEANPIVPLSTPGFAPGETNPNTPTTSPVDPARREQLRQQLLTNGFGGQLDAARGGGLKLDSSEHGQKSPKYMFAQTALDMGLAGKTEDLPVLLAELQKRDPRFQGWGVNKDKLVFQGQGGPHADFGGKSVVDTILRSGAGGEGFWWGVDDTQRDLAAPQFIQQALMGAGQPSAGVTGTGVTGGQDFNSERMREQIMQALQTAGLKDFASIYGY